ncbi:late control protein [Salmonella enterica subsp. salamae]|nr:late control protein [Salmonella enterica subsp. salamae]ECJ2281374.1 late control protein [Salmonella enterica subsp. salamae]
MSQYTSTGDMPWEPNFSISAEGSDITDEIRENLINLQITDYGGGQKKSDQIAISIVSEHLDLPKKGAKLEVGIGFGQELVDKGTFVVDAVNSGGSGNGPRLVQIVGRSFSKSNAYGHSTVQSQRLRSFSNITLGDLLNTIATEHGLTPRVPDELASKMLVHVDQLHESDMNLVTRLAASAGAVSKISHGYWILSSRDATTTISGKDLKKYTVQRDMTDNWSYHSNSDHPDSSSGGNGTQVISYYDLGTGTNKSITIGSGEPVMHLNEPTLSDAQELASAFSTTSKKKLVGMSVTMPAELEMMDLTAQCLITTSGFGTVEDRDWHISKLDFSLTPQAGMIVTMELE